MCSKTPAYKHLPKNPLALKREGEREGGRERERIREIGRKMEEGGRGRKGERGK